MMQSDTAGQAGDRQVTMVPRKIRKKRAHDLLFFCSLFVFTTVQVARRGSARRLVRVWIGMFDGLAVLISPV